MIKWNPILVKLTSGEEIIINEIQIVSVKKVDTDYAEISFSSGEKIIISHPSYSEWNYDFLSKKE